eukprot:scaffold1333_cov274-Prasinococcus_capsulatus_cf.AAC.1
MRLCVRHDKSRAWRTQSPQAAVGNVVIPGESAGGDPILGECSALTAGPVSSRFRARVSGARRPGGSGPTFACSVSLLQRGRQWARSPRLRRGRRRRERERERERERGYGGKRKGG